MHFFTAKTTGTLRLKPPLSHYEKAKNFPVEKKNPEGIILQLCKLKSESNK